MIQMPSYCFLPPDISQVALCTAAAEKIVTKIKLSGKLLRFSNVRATEPLVMQSLKEIRAEA